MRHTVRSLADKAGVTIVGNDIAFLSSKSLSNHDLALLEKCMTKHPRIQQVLLEARREVVHLHNRRSEINLIIMDQLVDAARNGHCWIRDDAPFELLKPENEPDWFGLLPKAIQSRLRVEFAATDGTEPRFMNRDVPYAGFGYILPHGDMTEDAVETFNMNRLQRIRQLSFLCNPAPRERDRGAWVMMFPQTRFVHVHDVYAIERAMAPQLKLNEQQQMTLFVTGITHDTLTPAGGDSVKLIDPKKFDEDAQFPSLLVGEPWEKFRQKYGVNQELLIQTVLNRGLLGQIQDICDKLGYLGMDALRFAVYPDSTNGELGPTQYQIRDMLEKDPHICGLWESARVVKGQLVFLDGERMARFLKLRALMFRGLYYNPHSRFFEYLVGKGVVKYLYDHGQITYQQLITETDDWLEAKIDEALGDQYVLSRLHNLEHALIEEHPDIATAKRRAQEINRDPNRITIVDGFVPSTSDGTAKFRVRWRDEYRVFADAYPRQAEDIVRIMTFPEIVHVYSFDARDLRIPPEGIRRLKLMLSECS